MKLCNLHTKLNISLKLLVFRVYVLDHKT